MRTFNPLLFFISLFLFISCSKDDVGPDVPEAGDITFAIDIASANAKFNNTWQSGDQVGVFAVRRPAGAPASLASSGNYLHNLKLTYNGSSWIGEANWPEDDALLDFYAYYPYDAAVTDPTAISFTAAADQDGTTGENSNYTLSDLMAGKADNNGEGYDKDRTVKLTLDHHMAMVEVAVSARGYDPAKLSVELSSLDRAVTLNLGAVDGPETFPGESSSTNIKMYMAVSADPVFTFRALVPAQTVAQGKVLYTVKYDNDEYPADALTSETTLGSGEVHTYRFEMTPTEITGISTAAQIVELSTEWNLTEEIENEAERRQAQGEVISRWSSSGSPDGTIYLINDIDMSSVANLVPIGWIDRYGEFDYGFTGTFDGQGYTINNLSVELLGSRDDDDYRPGSCVGLFGILQGGTVRNLNLRNHDVHSVQRAGGIVGYNSGGTVENCNVHEGKTYTDLYFSGGIVGINFEGTVTNCHATGTNASAWSQSAGGIVGRNERGTITGCSFKDGEVRVSYTAGAGGITADNTGYGALIENCVVEDSEIYADSDYAGGISGQNFPATIRNCTVRNCKISTGEFHAGGILGATNGENSVIENCEVINTDVSAITDAGGIVGVLSASLVTGCTVTGGTITTSGNYSGGIAGENMGNIYGCSMIGTVVNARASAGGVTGANGSGSTTINCTVSGEGIIKALTERAGGITGHNFEATVTACTVNGYRLETPNYGGGIAGDNYMGIINGCKIVGGSVTAGTQYAGGITGHNDQGFISGCISSPEILFSPWTLGIIAGYNSRSINSCYGVTGVDPSDLVGDDDGGTVLGGGLFDKDDITETGNFFTTVTDGKTPMDLMNEVLSGMGAGWHWIPGNTESDWYPIITSN